MPYDEIMDIIGGDEDDLTLSPIILEYLSKRIDQEEFMERLH